jgi:hypothetical protein
MARDRRRDKSQPSPPPPTPDDRKRTHEFRLQVLRSIAITVYIIASALPVYFIADAFKSAAGKETTISVGLNVVLSVTGVAAIIYAWRSRKREMKMIEKLAELERQQ